MIPSELIDQMKAHAIRAYPEEACGIVSGGLYWPIRNMHPDPTRHFRMDPRALLDHPVEAIFHSHPGGPLHPSRDDMHGQIGFGCPWVIVATDGHAASEPVIWGGDTPIAPLIGRSFVHGVTDCYSLIRDAFRVGREGLAAQGIPDWPHDPIDLPEFPRDDEWWKAGENLYEEGFAKAGFRRISESEIRPGDVFLAQIRSEVTNHGGVLVEDHVVLHHLAERLSRREPWPRWRHYITHWLRHDG